MKMKSLPRNSSFANANPARVVRMNCPINTTVTNRNVFIKYLSHGAPAHAVRKLSKVHAEKMLKFTASDVE